MKVNKVFGIKLSEKFNENKVVLMKHEQFLLPLLRWLPSPSPPARGVHHYYTSRSKTNREDAA